MLEKMPQFLNKDLIRVEKFSLLMSNVKKRKIYILIPKLFHVKNEKIDLEDNFMKG